MELLIVWISWGWGRGGSLDAVVAASGRRKTKNFPLEVSAPQSSLQSIHVAEVHFDFIKIR